MLVGCIASTSTSPSSFGFGLVPVNNQLASDNSYVVVVGRLGGVVPVCCLAWRSRDRYVGRRSSRANASIRVPSGLGWPTATSRGVTRFIVVVCGVVDCIPPTASRSLQPPLFALCWSPACANIAFARRSPRLISVAAALKVFAAGRGCDRFWFFRVWAEEMLLICE
ncbi:hypothetical protein Aduo_017007 [Ancylostoma duodenale]